MKLYNSSDFEKYEAWLVFRLDMKIADNFHDLYLRFFAGRSSVEEPLKVNKKREIRTRDISVAGGHD